MQRLIADPDQDRRRLIERLEAQYRPALGLFS